MASETRVYNPHTAAWESPGKDDTFRVKEHAAQVEGNDPPSTGEYTGSALLSGAKNEPRPGGAEDVAGPVVTSNEAASWDTAGTVGSSTARNTARKG